MGADKAEDGGAEGECSPVGSQDDYFEIGVLDGPIVWADRWRRR